MIVIFDHLSLRLGCTKRVNVWILWICLSCTVMCVIFENNAIFFDWLHFASNLADMFTVTQGWTLLMTYPSSECYMIFWMMTIYSDTLHYSDITQVFYPVTDLDLISEYDFLPNCVRFPYNICNGCCMPTEGKLIGQRNLSDFGTCKCSNVETNLSWTFPVYGLLSSSFFRLLSQFEIYLETDWMIKLSFLF